VLRNRPFVSFLGLNMLFIAVGIVPLVEFLPVYSKNGAGVSETAIGLIFFANTVFIVLFQLPIAKALEGRRRMPAFALMGVIWGASWLVTIYAVETLGALAAALVIGAAMVVFAAGECLHGTVQGPLVADLAEPGMVGRYMALSSLSWQFGFFLGPALGGAVLDAQPVALWTLCAAACALGSIWSLRLDRRLPKSVRRTPGRVPVPAAAAAPAPGVVTRPSG
jgi:MFS family permease